MCNIRVINISTKIEKNGGKTEGQRLIDKNLSRTLLEVYSYLERVAGAIDKVILKQALGSINLHDGVKNQNVFCVANDLIDLSERKVTLINLKVIIEEGLKKLSCDDSRYIIQKHIEKRTFADIAERNKISLRTAFRKVYSAEEKFFAKLEKLGYDAKYIFSMIKNEKWIFNIYNEVSKNNKEIEIMNDYRLQKMVFNSI